jgi:hypothetical protein
MEFRSGIPRNRLGTVSVIQRKKALILRHSKFRKSQFQSSERNGKKCRVCSELVSLPRNGSEKHSESLFLFFVAQKGFRVVFFSAEWTSKSLLLFWFHEREFPSCVLFRRRVWNRIMGVCFYFCSTEWNSELFFLLRKGIPRVFCSAEHPEIRQK